MRSLKKNSMQLSRKSKARFIVYGTLLLVTLIHVVHALTLDRIVEYKELPFYSSKISTELDGYRIAFISDTHEMPDERLREVAEKLNELDIDILLLGGDIPLASGTSRYAMEILSRVETTDGIYGVRGNHDFNAKWSSTMKEHGMVPLVNSGESVRGNLFLAGVEYKANNEPDVAKAIEAAPPDSFVLLLSHSPDFAMKRDTSDTDLILSGHTHGGQITFFGIWAPLFSFNKSITEYGQRFKSGWATSRDGTPVYVSKGTGYSPRIFSRPQVIIITLRCP